MTTTKTAAQAAEYVLVPRDAVNAVLQFGTCHEMSSQLELHEYVEARDLLLNLLAAPVRATGGELREHVELLRDQLAVATRHNRTAEVAALNAAIAALSAPAIAPGGDGSAALWALRIILHDLPQNRDWLDPEVEKFARELVAKHPGILPHDTIPAAGNAGAVDDAKNAALLADPRNFRPVAWEHQCSGGRNVLSYIENDERIENAHRVRPLLYSDTLRAALTHAAQEREGQHRRSRKVSGTPSAQEAGRGQ